MARLIKILTFALICLSFSQSIHAAGTAQQEKKSFETILQTLCAVGSCYRSLNPNISQDARDIISNSVLIVYNTNYEALEKFNAPLKSMGIENSLLIPAQAVDNALCSYYGYSVNQYPELQKAAQEQAPQGFYTVGMSDAGIAEYEINKLEVLKNGVMRASGTGIDGVPFNAYFSKSNCGGKAHWVLLRLVELQPYEESEDFQNPFK